MDNLRPLAQPSLRSFLSANDRVYKDPLYHLQHFPITNTILRLRIPPKHFALHKPTPLIEPSRTHKKRACLQKQRSPPSTHSLLLQTRQQQPRNRIPRPLNPPPMTRVHKHALHLRRRCRQRPQTTTPDRPAVPVRDQKHGHVCCGRRGARLTAAKRVDLRSLE